MLLAHYLILNFLSSLIWIINTVITIWYCINHYNDFQNFGNILISLYAYLSFILKTYIKILLMLHKVLILGYFSGDTQQIVNPNFNNNCPSIF